MTPPLTPLSIYNKPNPSRSLLSKTALPFPEVAGFTRKNTIEVIDPATIPLPKADVEEILALENVHGSEDFIIHDSEEEDCLSPVCIEKKSALNLGQFAYVA